MRACNTGLLAQLRVSHSAHLLPCGCSIELTQCLRQRVAPTRTSTSPSRQFGDRDKFYKGSIPFPLYSECLVRRRLSSNDGDLA